MTISTSEEVREFFRTLQDQICSALEHTDGKALFTEDTWTHHKGGGGRTRILCQGALFEQVGVNFSHVRETDCQRPQQSIDPPWLVANMKPWASPW